MEAPAIVASSVTHAPIARILPERAEVRPVPLRLAFLSLVPVACPIGFRKPRSGVQSGSARHEPFWPPYRKGFGAGEEYGGRVGAATHRICELSGQLLHVARGSFCHTLDPRSEERRVGKEGRSRWS